MELASILFWIAVVIVAWLGLRNAISMLVGESQRGPLMPGQRLCHAISVFIYWGACGVAIYYRMWWVLAVGFIVELLLRKGIILSGDVVYRSEKEMRYVDTLQEPENNRERID